VLLLFFFVICFFDEKGIEGRPGAVLPPVDFAALQKKLHDKHGAQFARMQDVNSYAMYPQVFEE
jgi:pyruvate carboxylase